jgi:hypothetical protein
MFLIVGVYMDNKLNDWREDGKHLPEFLRDFHDQKDFFKFLHEFVITNNNDMLKDIDWQHGHVYTIDMLLRVLGRFGWTLQRNRSHQNFDDLDEYIKLYNKNRTDKAMNSLAGMKEDIGNN